MKPTAAFAAGLWTGAVAVVAIGAFYLRLWDFSGRNPAASDQEKLKNRIQLLEQDQARAAAEESRLKQTISELQTQRTEIDSRRQERFLRREAKVASLPAPGNWMTEAVVNGDARALPQLEQAALAGDLLALDALALLAEQENADTLTRVWSSGKLSPMAQRRATVLLAATAELNPRAEELLQGLFASPETDPALPVAALAGLLKPDFSTELQKGEDFPAPPHFNPDYAQRLRMIDSWRAVVTNEQLLARIDGVRSLLAAEAAIEN